MTINVRHLFRITALIAEQLSLFLITAAYRCLLSEFQILRAFVVMTQQWEFMIELSVIATLLKDGTGLSMTKRASWQQPPEFTPESHFA
jgi:hypothetical protein